jgi:hypothetical protein
MINLQLNQKQAESILESNAVREKEIREAIANLRTELFDIGELNKKIRTLMEGKPDMSNISLGVQPRLDFVPSKLSVSAYSPTLTNIQKIAFVLKSRGKPMTSTEIVNAIADLQPEWNRMKIMRSISSVLSVGAKGDGNGNKIIYKKSTNERGENTYELKK